METRDRLPGAHQNRHEHLALRTRLTPGSRLKKNIANPKKVLAPLQPFKQCPSVMNLIRITSALLIGAFALILIAPSAQAQRPSRDGGTITPPPQPPPAVSQL